MKVTILQTDIIWGNPLENIHQAEYLMALEPDSDLFVLPEMWSTGFATDPIGIVEEEVYSVSLEWMKKTAIDRHCAICGSLAISANNCNYNRQYFVDGRKNVFSYYDKHHLFSYGGEDRFYTPGNSHTVVEYNGLRFLLVTCYDLRFPMWTRYSDTLQFDAIICVANWPESRQNAWQILTRARAIENQSYLIGCNRVGNDYHCHYRGQSAIISPIGKTLCRCSQNIVSAASCNISFEEVYKKRTKFRVLEERDLL